METDEEYSMFHELLKPSITQVDFNQVNPPEETSRDEYQLKDLNEVSSCTIDRQDDLQIEPDCDKYSNSNVPENLLETPSSSFQFSGSFLENMASYGFNQVEHIQGIEIIQAEVSREELNRSDNDEEIEEVASIDIDELERDDEVYLSSGNESDATEVVSEPNVSDDLGESEKENMPTDGKKRKYNTRGKLTRKRLRKPEGWVKNIRKAAVQKGLEYIHSKTQEVVPARALKRSCGPGCRFSCEKKIDEKRRKKIFDLFYDTKDQSAKHQFINRYVYEKSSSQENPTRKSFSRVYYLTNHEGTKVQVCKTMFLSTLSISKKVVDTALKKIRGDVSEMKDMRGSSNANQKIPQAVTDSVVEHINMFERVESHYARNDSKREYLHETLSLSQMYRLYTEWAEKKNIQKASKHHYSDIFNSEFNIAFFKPKKDQCDVCEKFKNSAQSDKPALEKEYNLHIANKDRSRLEKKLDIQYAKESSETTSLICFDFQKILSTPKSECSCLYYKRKLSVYNFTIYDVVRHKGYCYVWSENEAKRGSNEVASCLLHYFEMMKSKGVDTFLLYSDNCSGQNRNKFLFSMYTYASIKLKIDIKHTFLVVGHTQNEGDNVHAQIERYTKGHRIFSPTEWCEKIALAKENEPKYDVINVTKDMIYNFKDLALQQNWNRTFAKDGKKVSIGVSKFKVVRAFKTHPNQLEFRTEYDGEYIKLATRKEREQKKVEDYELSKAYNSVQGIPAAKLKDLLTLCDMKVIPIKYHSFYQSLTVRKNNGEETGNIDDE